MLEFMRRSIRSKTTEVLEERMQELYGKILHKRKLIDKYSLLIAQMEGNCSTFVDEYEAIDMIIFIRENKIRIPPPERKEKEKKVNLLIKEKTGELTKEEASTLLKQLLAIRENRLSKEESL